MTALSRRHLFGLFAGAAVAPMLGKAAVAAEPALASVGIAKPVTAAALDNTTRILSYDLFRADGVVTKVGAFIHGVGPVEYSLEGLAIEPGDKFGLYASGPTVKPMIARPHGEAFAMYSLDDLRSREAA